MGDITSSLLSARIRDIRGFVLVFWRGYGPRCDFRGHSSLHCASLQGQGALARFFMIHPDTTNIKLVARQGERFRRDAVAEVDFHSSVSFQNSSSPGSDEAGDEGRAGRFWGGLAGFLTGNSMISLESGFRGGGTGATLEGTGFTATGLAGGPPGRAGCGRAVCVPPAAAGRTAGFGGAAAAGF